MTKDHTLMNDSGKYPITSSTRRDTRFDILRIAAMLLIVACHFIANIGWHLESPEAWLHGGPAMAADQLLGQVGSCLFFMITGYFLVAKPFRARRIIDTVVQTFLYSALFLLLQAMLLMVHPTSGVVAMFSAERLPVTLYGTLLPVFNGAYWFITAYVLMLAVSPYLNMVVTSSSRRTLTLIRLLLGISVMALLSMTQLFWNNWCYAVTGYLIGGWIRTYGMDSAMLRRLRWGHVVVAAVAAYGVLAVFDYLAVEFDVMDWLKSDARYVTGMIPALSIIVASTIFMMVAKRVPHRRRAAVRETSHRRAGTGKTLSATVFGVYLIHNNPYVRPNLWQAVTSMLPEPDSFVVGAGMGVVVVVAVFLTCAVCAFVYDAAVVRPVQRVVGRLLRLRG
ncbi:acyltransferase [Bifidobacterium sp. 82T24]|uniref:acyltransferase family protein n=1 Tax=Bifidobacterium pluvialisilvae TaxID=2834436 RepID=UPI001C568E42|nr:acyltransferase [Bifidobacterium pluvialisilvae]MBW3087488.1 acyltransferase [Bifidobacterium pluvialisilvae]